MLKKEKYFQMKFNNNYKIKMHKNKKNNNLKIWKMQWFKLNYKEMMKKLKKIYSKKNKKCKNIQMIQQDKNTMMK